MSNEIKLLSTVNRIKILEARPKENTRIVQKLKRRYRILTGKEYTEVE